MKVVILAGGHGTRISEETVIKPKPMVEIGGKPILWHIMKTYSHYGFNDFVILLGYKGYYIKEYFLNYTIHQSDITIDMVNDNVKIINNATEPWKVTLLETGLNTLTGSRVKKAKHLIGGSPFFLTYGDGVANINIKKELEFHRKHGKAITVTSAMIDGRFGSLNISNENKITNFLEKPKGGGGWINAGFFICEPKVLKYIGAGNNITFEQEPLSKLADEDEMFAYKHNGFWKPMDTLRDKKELQNMWEINNAPWKIW
jgi:glucose-1-phosphate cytidylyltransferase